MFTKKYIREILDWVLHIAIAILIGYLLVTFVVQITVVEGRSMLNSLQGSDRLIVEKLTQRFGSLHHGDIVTINHTERIANGRSPLIKRIIGLEGDTVEIKDGKVFVNNEQLVEEYINGDYTNEVNLEYTKVTVPKGKIYVMGDNRVPGESLDSRTFGPIDAKKVGGKAILRFYPFDRFGRLMH